MVSRKREVLQKVFFFSDQLHSVNIVVNYSRKNLKAHEEKDEEFWMIQIMEHIKEFVFKFSTSIAGRYSQSKMVGSRLTMIFCQILMLIRYSRKFGNVCV